MYSGFLPKGLSEADLSPDEEEENTQEKQNKLIATETEKCPAESEQNVQNDLSSSSSSSSSSSPPDSCLPGVSQDLWQKFKDLQKERVIQKMDQPPTRKRGKKRHRKGGTLKQASDAEEKRDGEEVRVKQWEELTQYFGTNDRFQPPASSRPSPKSGLEKNMERAIAEGDYGKAEELSDRLATRELAVKIAQAADCRDFARARREEEDSRAARKKRKQIAWGFEAKKRWETKSNMGYM
ncbi:protein FAM204A [Pangasianodon hypophthalmus]|uniref:protein FAM204A n=1 Tax=Pangasianodon hypophthalmus TaxID=310915 RepID=UPI00230817B2|nr:protein FAM204A [Pangasianodon hypophthalmus]